MLPSAKRWISDNKWYLGIACGFTTLGVFLSIGLGVILILRDVNYTVPVSGVSAPQLSLAAELLAVNTDARTLTMDWFPIIHHCASVVDIFFDPNLLDITSPGMDRNQDIPSDSLPSLPTFRLNTATECSNSLKASFATFRTISKLNPGTGMTTSRLSNLQAYPFDVYVAQISIFAQGPSNDSILIDISETWGVAVNFRVDLSREHFDNGQRLYTTLTVRRSAALKLFMLFMVISNWLVTLAFIWITLASMFYQEKVISQLFVLPIGALFAFTAVRANAPGAPPGFGTILDFVGILPNLGIISLCSALLLGRVLFGRIP